MDGKSNSILLLDMTWHNEMYNGMQIHIRQYPPMFNMFKLAHHVDANFSWYDIFSMFAN